ncbi:cytochrome C oxidase subunit IV family protein [Mycobacterium sp.]|uniref:cytochrome C oxidase subunit IV family protein n=1 Tax=Mycobacterium sp. TaxID=1785 RepID=UPI003D11DA6A
MRELVRQRASAVFAAMVLVTCFSFWLTVGHGASAFHEAAKAVWATVIVLACIKMRWIMLDFMELRTAPLKLRLLFEFWTVCVGAALIITNVVVG